MAGASRAVIAVAALLASLALSALSQGALGGEFESGRAALADHDHAEAVASLLPLAQQGDEAARMKLLFIANDYRDGVKVPQKCTRAVDIMARLVGMGHLPSLVNLGSLYVKGCAEVPANPEQGIGLIREAAEKGDLVGQLTLGTTYANGLGVARDYGEAMRWFRRAADRGSPQGQYDVGLMYAKGEGVQQDLAEAERWFTLAVAQGHAGAKGGLLSVATMYAAGAGAPRQCTRAVAIMRRLADAGFAPASVHLGWEYLLGCAEVDANVAEGIRLTRMHAERGDATAQANFGWAHATGTGVPQDFGEAMRWSRMSADQGSPHGQAYVGLLYLLGQGVARDVAEAKHWLGLASAQQHGPAKETLARLELAESQDPRSAAYRASARSAPAAELAWRYAHGVAVLGALWRVKSNVTLQLPEGPVTRQNLEQTRADYTSRVTIDSGVIRDRGSRDIHGRYRATADPACGNAQSAWASAIVMLNVREIELRQDGFLATIEQHGPAGEAVGWRAHAVIVESSLAFPDPMNMDYALVGIVADGTITIHPDVDVVLRAWPEWVPPPSRDALAACVVTLTRSDGAAGRETPAEGAPPRGIVADGPAAADLARAYADVVAKRKVVAALLSGEMVRLPEKPNAKDEYAREKQALDAREASLGATIRERGFANLAGRYRAAAPADCKQAASPWVAAVAGGAVREVDIHQDGFVATVVERGPRGRRATAIVVESTFVMTNPMGGSHAYVGAVGSDAIRLHPDFDPRLTHPSSLVGGAQSARAAAECIVTLTRVP